jgi:membrane protein
MSFSMMIASVGFLLMVSLVNTVMDVMYFWLLIYFPECGSLSILCFLILLYYLPRLQFCAIIFKTFTWWKKWMERCFDRIGFYFFFMFGKFAIGFYLGSSALQRLHRQLDQLLLFSFGFYYSIILYFGARVH